VKLVLGMNARPVDGVPMPKYVVVWLDYSQAQFFHVHPERFDESTIWAKTHEVKRHASEAHGASALMQQKQFFSDVAGALNGIEEVLVVGPSTAKLDLLRYAYESDPGLSPRIVGIETVEHANDGQLVKYARHYFMPASSMR
jgi:stalled ribosome rescue protein Dom34